MKSLKNSLKSQSLAEIAAQEPLPAPAPALISREPKAELSSQTPAGSTDPENISRDVINKN